MPRVSTSHRQGNYEFFDTAHGHRILVLNGEQWFAWVEVQKCERLAKRRATLPELYRFAGVDDSFSSPTHSRCWHVSLHGMRT